MNLQLLLLLFTIAAFYTWEYFITVWVFLREFTSLSFRNIESSADARNSLNIFTRVSENLHALCHCTFIVEFRAYLVSLSLNNLKSNENA